MESKCAFASKEQYLIVSDLMSKAHVARHPVGLVDLRSCNFLPDIARYVINFYCVNNSLLIDSSTECEDVIVLKDTKGSSSARHTHISNEFPLILLRIVHFTVSVDLISNKCANHVDEVLDRANRMIGVWIVHVAHLIQDSKKIIVSVTVLEVNAHVLHIASRQVNRASFRGN